MSAEALHSRPYPMRYLADDFSVLLVGGVARWIILRDGRRVSVH